MYTANDFEQLGKLCSSKETTSEKLEEIYAKAELEGDAFQFSYISSIIAANPNASVDLLTKMYNRRDPLTLAAILNNPQFPKNLLYGDTKAIKQSHRKLKEARDVLNAPLPKSE